MRKPFKLMLVLCSIMLSANAYSQEEKKVETTEVASSKKNKLDFEGVIVYGISFPTLPAQMDERAKALLPKEMKLYIKGNQQRLEMQQTTSVKSVTITDSKTQNSTMLMDIMDKKLAVKVTKEDIEKELAKSKAPQIVYLEGTKTIAGYSCKKAELVYEGGEKSTVYYTEDIDMDNASVNFTYNIPTLKGFPLEFEMDQKGVKMRMTAIKVSKELVPITLFMVPEGYKEVARDELQKSLGGSH